MALHSLVLHMGTELGLIGLVLLTTGYSAVLRRAWVHRKLTGEVVPLAGALSMCVDALAHNSFNPLIGIYLGLALTDLSCWRVLKPLPTALQRTGWQPGYALPAVWPAPGRRRRSRFIDAVLPANFQ
jgi:hypothetical protein